MDIGAAGTTSSAEGVGNMAVAKIGSQKKAVIYGVGLALLLIALQIGLFVQLQLKARESRHWVDHTATVLDQVGLLLSKVKDAELSERAYQLTGDIKTLRLFLLGTGELRNDPQADFSGITDRRSIDEVLTTLLDLTKDNAEQQQRLVQLGSLIDKKIALSRTNIQHRRETPLPPETSLDPIQLGLQAMRDIRTASTTILTSERSLLGERSETDRLVEANLVRFISIAAFVTYGALFLLIMLVIRSLLRSQQASSELVHKEAYFRAAAEGGLNALFIFRRQTERDLDRAGSEAKQGMVLDYLNPLAKQMAGDRLAALQAGPVSAILPAIHGGEETSDELCQKAMTEQQVQEREYAVTSGPFAGRYLQEQIIPLPTGLAVNCRDITDRKQVDNMKNEFVSTVSHELRTPLTAIRGSLGLIVGGIAGEISTDVKSMLTIAYNNCERLVRLINDILDIEKIEAGRMVFDRRPIAILPFLRQAIEVNLGFGERYGVAIKLDDLSAGQVGDDVKVFADYDRLMQVATNLISNAVKFSRRQGTVTLICRARGGQVEVEVRDRGIGIPVRFQSQIFQKFAQADGSDSRPKGGTGLGLSIAKSIIEEMGGIIRFESEEDIGTSFFFSLPVMEQVADPIPVKPAILRNESGQRVLICEDELDISHLLQLILEREGLSSDVANDANTAFAKLQAESYRALILDLMLPDKCGISLIREIRDEPALSKLPIIVVSAKADLGKRFLKGDAVSIVDWMTKPVDTQRLVETLRKLPRKNGPSKVLHVEDDKDLADILKLSLADVAEATWVPTLTAAREKLKERRFDLVVLDVGLPDGSGFDLLPCLGAGGEYPTPVVLFTANEVPIEIARSVSAALVKSKTSEERLVRTIKQFVGNLSEIEAQIGGK